MSRIPVNSIPRNEDYLTMNRVPTNSIPKNEDGLTMATFR
jgi:hypothetical protein